MRILETKVYTLKELSPEARKTAIDNCRQFGVNDDFWYESTIESFKEMAESFGLEIDDIYFRGFASQGDGACFTGRYQYKRGALQAIKSEYPNIPELHEIVRGLQFLQSSYFYQLEATITSSGRYCHEYSASVETSCIEGYRELPEEEMTELLRDFMRYIYRSLEEEYYYQTSDESVADMIDCNEYEFTSTGVFI